jgi:hypothetical protein
MRERRETYDRERERGERCRQTGMLAKREERDKE